MSKKIGLHIAGRRFDIDVEEKFALFLEKEIADDFDMEGSNDLKILLQAYIKKNHQLYLQRTKIDEVLKKISINPIKSDTKAKK
ncbi:hypothetical protein MNB_SM-5-324 [hydrothermal vent metagenome]|uniref:Uncharacterized protein n=1 Tax=hydrothermal vent metagenome TaxID=652676 RepID=A0A1W1BJY5_9ZZZZ